MHGRGGGRLPLGQTGNMRSPRSPPALPGEKRMDYRPFKITNGELSTLAHVGAADEQEFRRDLDDEALQRSRAHKGYLGRLDDGRGGLRIPDICVRSDIRVSDDKRLLIP